jgi:hypothetical protein
MGVALNAYLQQLMSPQGQQMMQHPQFGSFIQQYLQQLGQRPGMQQQQPQQTFQPQPFMSQNQQTQGLIQMPSVGGPPQQPPPGQPSTGASGAFGQQQSNPFANSGYGTGLGSPSGGFVGNPVGGQNANPFGQSGQRGNVFAL